MAKVVVARIARRGLLELEWPLIDAVVDALALLERDPSAGYELRGRLRDLRSLRIGSYRIIYQLTDGAQAVRVAAIRHRASRIWSIRDDRRTTRRAATVSGGLLHADSVPRAF